MKFVNIIFFNLIENYVWLTLVITIIVMLVLAGVSINAIIGDNGVITNAQNAKFKSGMAGLEEFLQEKYIENFEEFSDSQANLTNMISFVDKYSDYFYNPFLNGMGTFNHIVTGDIKALFLINKSGLPTEIRDALVGGDAGERKYSDYASLNDVYGVTSQLKVYYCKNGLSTIDGITLTDLDDDNPLMPIVSNTDPIYSSIIGLYDKNSDGKIDLREVKNITDLTLNAEYGGSDLSELYKLTSLKTLTIKDKTLESLAGLENAIYLTEIIFENSTITDYSAISKISSNITSVKFIDATDNEITKFCSADKNGFPKLTKFFINPGSQNKKVSDISGIAKLKNSTKSARISLDFSNNLIEKLTYKDSNENKQYIFKDFSNVRELNISNNVIHTLDGIEKLTSLRKLIVSYNLLGKDVDGETSSVNTDAISYLTQLSNLNYLDLRNNSDLYWVGYIASCTGLTELYLAGCSNMNVGAVTQFAQIYNRIDVVKKSIDSKFTEYLTSSDVIIKKNLKASDTITIDYLLYMSQDQKSQVRKLDLSGCELSNTVLNEILGGVDVAQGETQVKFPFNRVVCLNLTGCVNLSSLDFINKIDGLQQLCFENTRISGDEVAKLDTYETTHNNCLMSFKCNYNASYGVPMINVTKMQKTISSTSCYTNRYAFTDYCGAAFRSVELVRQLPNCEDITYFCSNQMITDETAIDLSGCTKLTGIYLQGGGPFILPASLTNISNTNLNPTPWWPSAVMIETKTQVNYSRIQIQQPGFSFARVHHFLNSVITTGSTIDTVELNLRILDGPLSHSDSIGNILKDLSQISIRSLIIFGINDAGVNPPSNIILDLDKLANGFDESKTKTLTSYWTNKLDLIQSFHISSDVKSAFNLTSLDFLSNCTNLKSLEINNCAVNDIEGITGLSKLTKIDLNDNSISELHPLIGLTNLETLILCNNALVDGYSITVGVGEDSHNVPYNNLQIIKDLKSHSLTTVQLSGNNQITDSDTGWRILASITGWNNSTKSGW